MFLQAQHIIEKLGGIERVANITGRGRVAVYRWTYPRERGGTNGLIPSDIQQVIMSWSRDNGNPIQPDDFFPPLQKSDAA